MQEFLVLFVYEDFKISTSLFSFVSFVFKIIA